MKLNGKTIKVEKLNNREVKAVIGAISDMTPEEMEAIKANPNAVSMASNLDRFAKAIVLALKNQVTEDELWDADPEETLKVIEELFNVNKVASLVRGGGKIQAQLR